MTQAQKTFFYLAFSASAVTGAALAIIRYFVEPSDPFAIVNHPLQPLIQHGHILVVPVLVFSIGWIWQDHVLRHLRTGQKHARKSGWAVAVLFPLVAASGYAFQVTSAEAWQTAWRWIHLGSSILWTAATITHVIGPLSRKFRTKTRTAPTEQCKERATSA